MRPKVKSNLIAVCFLVLPILLGGQKAAYSQFNVDWRNSYDNGLKGTQQIAQWLVDSGHYGDILAAENFAETGYLGYGAGDADPYFWDSGTSYRVEVVQEISAYEDLNKLGIYTGSGGGKVLSEVFSGIESGPAVLPNLNLPFGFYLKTPEGKTWYTDRTQNTQQSGVLLNARGDAQALIYELSPGSQWLVAWEDLDATTRRSDNDYNDLYLTVTVAPEPVGSMLFLLGGGVLTAARMRRKMGKKS